MTMMTESTIWQLKFARSSAMRAVESLNGILNIKLEDLKLSQVMDKALSAQMCLRSALRHASLALVGPAESEEEEGGTV